MHSVDLLTCPAGPAFAIIGVMVVRRIAKSSEHARLSALVQKCAFQEALDLAVADIAGDLGEYAMATLDDAHQAERATITALADFYRALPTLGAGSPRTFLFAATHRACQAAIHKRDSTPVIRTPAYGIRERSTLPETTSTGTVRRPPVELRSAGDGPTSLRHELGTLRDIERTVALLRYLGRLSYGDIAHICDLTPQETQRLAGKALLRIRNRRQDQAFDSNLARDEGGAS